MKPFMTLFAALSLAVAARAQDDADDFTLEVAPPVVVRTVPESGSAEVSSDLKEIKVTFSKPMEDDTWSWVVHNRPSFPATTGKPKYLDDKRTCVLPVKLERGKTYAVWVNAPKYQGFKDEDGQAAVPYLVVFKTKK